MVERFSCFAIMSKLSVVVIEARIEDQMYPPSIYFIDWGNAKLAEASGPLHAEPSCTN